MMPFALFTGHSSIDLLYHGMHCQGLVYTCDATSDKSVRSKYIEVLGTALKVKSTPSPVNPPMMPMISIDYK